MSRLLAFCALICWVLLLWPYPSTVFLAACTACLTYPMFCRFQAAFHRPMLAISAFTVILASIFLVPISLFIMLVAPQGVAGVKMFNQIRADNWQLPESIEEKLLSLQTFLFQIPGVEKWWDGITSQAAEIMENIFKVAITGSLDLAGSAASYVWHIILFFILTLLALSFGPLLKTVGIRLTNFSEEMYTRFTISIRSALRGVVLGVLLVAVIQGLLAGIGFSVAGVPQPAFWGLFATIFSPIPFVGTAMVWVPLCLYLWLNGSLAAALGLALWCLVVVTSVDNFLRPLFLKTGIAAPMFVLMMGILCGMAMFGAIGLIVGPVLIALSIQAMLESNQLMGAPVMTSIKLKKANQQKKRK